MCTPKHKPGSHLEGGRLDQTHTHALGRCRKRRRLAICEPSFEGVRRQEEDLASQVDPDIRFFSPFEPLYRDPCTVRTVSIDADDGGTNE